MRKSVLLMAGLMTVALAGSAQAAGNTMFAVQDSTPTDRFTVSDTGVVNAAGADLPLGGKLAITLNNAPVPPSGKIPLTAAYGPFHAATIGSAGANAAFLAQHVTTGAGTYAAAVAPSFSFYRLNQNTADSSYVLPQAGHTIGAFTFGTINATVDANASRLNGAKFSVVAESNWSGVTAAGVLTIDTTPSYFLWTSTSVGGGYIEKMRLTSTGNLIIGLGSAGTSPKLRVIGLPVSADETGLPVPAGVTTGDFYRTPLGVVRVAL
jgi:hypothetical protein